MTRLSVFRSIVVGVLFAALPSAALAQKEISPSADMQTIKAGSLIIAMDNDKQNIGSLFNVASYGLAIDLLNNNIPLKWAIRAGKAKDGSDFTATVARFAPSAQAQTSLTFSGGPFIVEESYANLARARITAFGRNVAVYELMQDTQIDIRYELLFKPRPFVNTTNSGIITGLFTNAGITTYTVGPDFSVENTSCYTIIMEPHNDVTTGVPTIQSFVATGGNFYAQCLSVTAFENAGKFMSDNGFTGNNVSPALTYPRPDHSFSQFIGAVNPSPGGSVEDWFLTAGSIFKSGVTSHAESGSGATLRYAATQRKTISPELTGGLVFYVGGHNHSGNALIDLNAQRLMFNAVMTPSRRPDVCNIQPLEIPVSDITISKSHSGAYMSGTAGTYSFTIGNIGDRESVDDIVVTDTLAVGLTFNSGSGSGWTFSSTVIGSGRTVVTATYAPSIPINGSTNFTIEVGIGPAAVGTAVNTAHVVGGGEVNLANNTSSVSVEIVGMSGRVFEDFGTIGAFDGADLPFAGMTVNIVNNSVMFTTTTNAQGEWSIAGLFPNTTATVTIPTTGGNAILAGATQSVGTNPSDHSVGGSGTAAGGDDGFRNILTNLSVAKTGPATALVTDTIQYVITTTNLGPNPALSVVVTDTLPALATFVYASRGGTVSGNVITWPAATLAMNATLVDTVRVRAPPDTTTLLNIAAATTTRFDTDVTDNNGSQSGSRVSTVLQIPDLTITKTHTGDFTVGANGTYTITLNNIGTGHAPSAVVTDTLPAGLTYVSAAAVSGTWSFSNVGQEVTATLTSPIAVSGSASFTITVLPGAAALPSVSNTASVVAVKEQETGNNTATDPTNVTSADLTVTKSSPSFTQGSNGDYTLTVTNVGNGPSTGNIVVRDSLAAGLSYVSAASVTGSWSFTNSGQIVTATLAASLAANETASFTITVLPGPAAYPSVDNIAVVSGGSQLIFANDTARLTTSLAGSSDLTLAKSASPSPFVYGSNGTYTITVNNIGAIATSGNVIVTDTLPAGLTFVSGTGTDWAFTSSVIDGGRTLVTATYSGAALPALSGTTNFSITALVLSTAASVTNTGWASGGGDSSPANNSGSVTTPVTGQSDLTIMKRSPESFTQGTPAAYTIVVRNVGASATSGTITVRDTVPAGVTRQSSAQVVGSWSFTQSGNAVTATTTGVLQPGDSAVFSITVLPLAAGVPSVTNKAVVSNPNQTYLANDTAYVTTPVGGLVDLAITKTAPASPFTEYTQGSYRIKVANIGSAPSSGTITVVDTLLAGITYVSGAGTNWTINAAGQVVTATHAGSIAVGDSAVFTMTIAVGNVATSVSNTARVSGGGDSNAANNISTISTPVTQVPNLSLSKTSSTFTVGQKTATYTIVVSNAAGAATATAPITVVDTLPVGVRYLSNSASGNNWGKPAVYDSVTRVLTATLNSNLNAGSNSHNLILTVEILAEALPSVTNRAWVSGGGDTTPEDNSASVTTPVVAPDISITKTSVESFSIGSLIDKAYTFNVTNLSPGAALLAGDTIRIVDTLPVNVTALAKDGSGDWTLTYDAATRVMTAFHTKAVAVGASPQQLQVDVTFGPGTPPSVTNTARVFTAGDVTPANNISSVTTPVLPPNISLTKTSVASFSIGSNIDKAYSFNVTNLSPGAALLAGDTIRIVDTLPVNVTALSKDGSGDWTLTYDPVTRVMTAFHTKAVAVGASTQQLQVDVTFGPGTPPSVTNTARAFTAGDITPANNVSSVTTPVAGVDLAISKTSSALFTPGTTGLYTLTVTNVGTTATTGTITVTDTLPANLTLASSGPTTVNGWSVTVTNPGSRAIVTATRTPPGGPVIAAGASSSFTVSPTVTAAAMPSVYNKAYVSGGGQLTSPANDTSSVITPVASPDLTLSKAAAGTFEVAANAAYRFTVTNIGNYVTSGNIVVTDTLPAGLTYYAPGDSLPAGWTVNTTGQVVVATFTGTLAPSAATTFKIGVTVGEAAAPSVTNIARVSGGNDQNLTNNVGGPITTLVGGQPDLAVTKTATTENFTYGATGSYTIQVSNVGTLPTSAGITVTDTLAAGMSFVSGAGTDWTVTHNAGVITATNPGPIATGGSSSFTVNVTVGVAATSVTNIARVAGGGQTNFVNDSSWAVTPIVAPDLTLTKAATSVFETGSNATYRFAVRNVGTAPTNGDIVVTDTLPAGLTFVSGLGTGWAVSAVGQNVTATYTGAALGTAPADSAHFTITVAVGAAALPQVSNTAHVAGGGEYNESNNTAGPVITPVGGQSDLTISKEATGSFQRGSNATYTITVTNIGTIATDGVITVTDTLPATMSFVSGEGSDWVVSAVGQVVTATYDGAPLGPATGNTNFTLTVGISVTAGASVTNRAWVSGGGELNFSNNSSETTTSLDGAPNITVVKSVLPATNIVPGSVLTYSISFANGGNAPAVNVVVTDDLPTQVQFKLGSIVESYPGAISATTEYFNGTVWTYTPVSEGCGAPAGYDGCVTKVRWSLQSSMPQVSNATVSLQVRVK